jgi:ferredoxin-like protein FixX
MRRNGFFIAVEVEDRVAGDPELVARLAESCPVDIYAQAADGTVELVVGNLDECVLCCLCLEATDAWGPGAVKVIKLYDGEALLA